jgi:hypothetical protein
VTSRRTPKCPYALGDAGAVWWKWAWKTSAAEAWPAAGALYTVARRAQLEDERAAIEIADDGDLFGALLEGADPDAIRKVQFAIGRLAASATASTGISREMRELEKALGLGPKAAKDLGASKTAPEKPKTNLLDDLAAKRASRRSS